jgi:hypothetical protein
VNARPRSPEEIRLSIESNRSELVRSVDRLRAEVVVATDWRRHLRRHKREVIIGAAVAGFVIGGGLAAVTGVFGRRR